jgi:hypothetical protein
MGDAQQGFALSTRSKAVSRQKMRLELSSELLPSFGLCKGQYTRRDSEGKGSLSGTGEMVFFVSRLALAGREAGNPVRLAATSHKGFAEGAMPSSNESAYSSLLRLAHKPMTARELEFAEQQKKFRKLHEIRLGYKGEWNAGARYFYSELIRASGLDDEWRELLMDLAKPTPGRKRAVGKAVQIALLKRQGMTAKQIAELLDREGNGISVEGVESYSKRRRKRSVAEVVRSATKAPS